MNGALNKIKALLLAGCVALGAGGCSLKDDIPEKKATDVTIRIIAPYVSAGTRAETDPVTNNSPLLFKGGFLVFSDSSGEIVYVSTVTTGMSAGELIGIDDLTSSDGAKVENVPNVSVWVDFFGNLPSSVTAPAEGGDIDDFRRTVHHIALQKDSDGGVSAVSIYGRGTLNTNVRPSKAEFNASAILSRVEVGKLEADGANIVSFDMVGVFMNYFYTDADLTGATDDDDYIKYTATNLFQENGEVYYATAYKRILYDYGTSLGNLNGYVYSPSVAGKVWAYNIFSGKAPHIIFKLKYVKASPAVIALNNGEDPYQKREYWYITVKGFSKESVQITEFEKGRVYSVSTIPVDPTTISPVPEPDDEVIAQVKVNVISWTDEDLSGNLPWYPW